MTLVYIIMLMVPITRVIARHTVEDAGSAAWVAPFIAGAVFIGVIFAIKYIVKQNEGKNLAEICRTVLGRRIGTLVNILYALWFVMLSAYYLRQFGERMATTVFFETSSAAFVAVMLACVGFALRFGPTVIIRTGSIFFYALALIFIFSGVVMLPQMDFENLLPVSFLDTKGILIAATDVLAALSYGVIFLVYFGDVKSKGFTKNILWATAFNVLMCVLATAVSIGIFSSQVVPEMIFPYFSAAKGIKIFDSIERVEAILISFFILADFIIIAFTLMSAQKMLCHTVGSGKTTPYYNMMLLGIFVISLYLGNNTMELNDFSKYAIIPSNLFFGSVIPIMLCIICLIKKKKE